MLLFTHEVLSTMRPEGPEWEVLSTMRPEGPEWGRWEE